MPWNRQSRGSKLDGICNCNVKFIIAAFVWVLLVVPVCVGLGSFFISRYDNWDKPVVGTFYDVSVENINPRRDEKPWFNTIEHYHYLNNTESCTVIRYNSKRKHADAMEMALYILDQRNGTVNDLYVRNSEYRCITAKRRDHEWTKGFILLMIAFGPFSLIMGGIILMWCCIGFKTASMLTYARCKGCCQQTPENTEFTPARTENPDCAAATMVDIDIEMIVPAVAENASPVSACHVPVAAYEVDMTPCTDYSEEHCLDMQTRFPLLVGSRVRAKYCGGKIFYPGVITTDHGDGTYDIEYLDGDRENMVKKELICPLEANEEV